MSLHARTTALLWSVTLCWAACSSPESPHGVAMFRGDPRHSGHVGDQGVDRLGGLRWQYRTDGPVRSSPTVLGDWLYVGSSDGHLYALDRATGSLRWKVDLESPVSASPAVAAGLVVVGNRAGAFSALDAGSGRERWRFATGDVIPWEWGFEGWDAYTSSPVVVDSLVLFGAGDGVLYALALASGRELWRFATGGRIRSSPAAADGLVVVGSADGRVYAVDLASGRERWRYEPEGVSLVSRDFGFDRKSIISSPALVDGTVYVGSRDGHMYAIDQATGALEWRADHRVSWAMSSPAIVEGALYSGTSDGTFVHALDVTSGDELWRFVARGYTWSSPAVAGDAVYIGDGGGNLWALDRATGEVRWRYRTRGPVLSSPAIADGMVYFGSDDGSVYALHGEGRRPHLAVFWDGALRERAIHASHDLIKAYFDEEGYAVLDARSLREFLTARIDDGEPSAVVFAMDLVPSTVASEPADTVLFRRYLDRGGKIVWLGLPPMLLTRDSVTGRVTAIDRDASTSLLGVSYSSVNFDSYGATATDLGRRWGVPNWWVGSYAIDPSDELLPLGLDENGRLAAWVRSYGGPEGTGLVSLPTTRVRFDVLPAIRAMVEYGLVNRMPAP